MAFTYFFRDAESLEAAIDLAMPSLRGRSFIDIWDAGCAHGPEPYTLAILLRERMSSFLFRNVRIHATDLDAGFASQVTSGVFPEAEVRRVPPALLARYFRPHTRPDFVEIEPELRAAIRFTHLDLLTLRPIREGLSMIVCKNVLLHLTEPQRVDVLRMFHRALQSDGLLVMEHTQKMPALLARQFQQTQTTSQVYRKVERTYVSHTAEELPRPAAAQEVKTPR